MLGSSTAGRFLLRHHHGRISSARVCSAAKSLLVEQRQRQQHHIVVGCRENLGKFAWRALSSSSKSSDSKSQTKSSENPKSGDNAEEIGSELVLTPGEKVVAASRLTMWAGIAAFAACCAYFIGAELFPTKMSPNRIFDRSLAEVRSDPEVQRRYGASLKAYGRDHGGKREGRRNFIEHTEYTDPEDGSKRVRVRYNLEGQFGNAFCFVEVSNQMDSGEFVYILVQDKANGRVHTIIDNRAALTAQRLSSGSKEAQSAMSQLLGNSSSSGGSGSKPSGF